MIFPWLLSPLYPDLVNRCFDMIGSCSCSRRVRFGGRGTLSVTVVFDRLTTSHMAGWPPFTVPSKQKFYNGITESMIILLQDYPFNSPLWYLLPHLASPPLSRFGVLFYEEGRASFVCFCFWWVSRMPKRKVTKTEIFHKSCNVGSTRALREVSERLNYVASVNEW